ncbi:hypothetical protein [Chitinibacter sp. GC72]|uniref:hypothetical protein n=1 Tax=Chitinibacter sp. GC72 TaxID=1526917 RepID=UPI0012F9C5B1|nr:hypothetical protein [Chitinibacter sp. GC72]
MTLVQRIGQLAARLAEALNDKPSLGHPALAKAWVCFAVENNQIVVRASHNMGYVARLAAGRYRLAFATPLLDTNYCWQAFATSPRNANSSATFRIASARATQDAKAATHLELICTSLSGNLADAPEINVVVYR